jgi:hypothetical protein
MQVSAAGPRFTATPAYFLGCLIFVSIVVLCCLRCAPILCTRCCGHQIYNFGSTYKGKIKASRLYLESPAVNLELSSWIRSRPIGSTRIFTVCRERDPRLLFCCETNQKQERETPKDREVLVRFDFLLRSGDRFIYLLWHPTLVSSQAGYLHTVSHYIPILFFCFAELYARLEIRTTSCCASRYWCHRRISRGHPFSRFCS